MDVCSWCVAGGAEFRGESVLGCRSLERDNFLKESSQGTAARVFLFWDRRRWVYFLVFLFFFGVFLLRQYFGCFATCFFSVFCGVNVVGVHAFVTFLFVTLNGTWYL